MNMFGKMKRKRRLKCVFCAFVSSIDYGNTFDRRGIAKKRKKREVIKCGRNRRN